MYNAQVGHDLPSVGKINVPTDHVHTQLVTLTSTGCPLDLEALPGFPCTINSCKGSMQEEREEWGKTMVAVSQQGKKKIARFCTCVLYWIAPKCTHLVEVINLGVSPLHSSPLNCDLCYCGGFPSPPQPAFRWSGGQTTEIGTSASFAHFNRPLDLTQTVNIGKRNQVGIKSKRAEKDNQNQ